MVKLQSMSGAALRTLSRTVLLSSVSALTLVGGAQAQGPQGGVVARGAAEISQTTNRTTVRQSSARATLDWRSFDVGAGHTVAFDQPNARAATLNRVTAGSESMIAGRITAPGAVIIQNTAGVVFAGTARIDTGSLVATSQRVDADRFQRDGGLTIGGGEAAGARVRNEGAITVGEAGLAALVGGDVSNAGAIMARKGTVALASGAVTTIDMTGDGLVRIAVDGDLAGGSSVVNTGAIDAAGGRVVLSAGAAARAMDAVINTSGLITAASASGDGGAVTLLGRGAGAVRLAGTIDASGGAAGGSVTATGAAVTLTADARIAARGGAAAGGKVHVGGEARGGGATRRAETTAVAEGARIDVRGDRGGEAVVWADGVTQFDGFITAGGPSGGGFVETSGREALGVGDAASVLTGAGGLWLLDPRDILIAGAGAGPDAGGDVTPTPGATPYEVSANAVVAALNAGGDVTVTTAQAESTMPGDLTVAKTMRWDGDGSLLLIADRDIIVTKRIESLGDGAITAAAGRDAVLSGELFTRGAGDVTVTAGRGITLDSTVRAFGAGDIALTAQTGDVAMNPDSSGFRGVLTDTGDIAMTAPLGSVLLRNQTLNGSEMLVFSQSGDVTVAAGDSIILEASDAPSGGAARIGRDGGSGDVTLTAQVVELLGGVKQTTGYAGISTGAGGALSVLASERITLQGDAPANAVIAAVDGATLRLEAPRQEWGGRVRSAAVDGTTGGGSVLVSGDITASFRPNFNLAAGQNFVLAPTAPDGAPSSYTSPLTHAVFTHGTGTIDLGGPVQAASLLYQSEESVTLRPGATVTGTGAGDAVVIAAGRAFDNQAGADALRVTAPGARWLAYVDTFAGMIGAEPETRGFDLYGRLFADSPDLTGLDGNRLIYGETPALAVTAESLSKVYGVEATPGVTVTGLRPSDSLAAVFAATPAAASDGAAAAADVGAYTVAALAELSAQALVQGYALTAAPGALTVTPAPLTITANDAERPVGQENPPFSARFDGFVLNQDVTALDGALGFVTPADIASPAGLFAITPEGLSSGNYAIAYVAGVLTVTEAPITQPEPPVTPETPAAPQAAALIFAAIEQQSGVPPLSVGDASFRTTIAEAPAALASPFVLTYSFGDITQNAPVGFVAASASIGGSANTVVEGGACGGPINIGATIDGCEEIVLTESFWSTIAERRP